MLTGQLISQGIAQQTYEWVNSAGGEFHTAANWNPAGGPPTFNDWTLFDLANTYTVTFGNNGSQARAFAVRGGNVTFSYLNATAQHTWLHQSTIGPTGSDPTNSATLNLTNMLHKPMFGGDLTISGTQGKVGTLNIFANGWWESIGESSVTVGQMGTGNLNISTVGSAQTSRMVTNNLIAGTIQGTGNISVSGIGASLTTSEDIVLGSGVGGTGSMNITNHGHVELGKNLSVGRLGQGNLVISNSGQLTTSNGAILRVGEEDGSSGKLTVMGQSTQLNGGSNSSLRIGNSGHGILDVRSGGVINVESASIGFGSGGTGVATVRHGGSQWNISGDLSVGNLGEGTLSIENAGTVNANNLFVGRLSESAGMVNVVGHNSSLNVAHDIVLGGNQVNEGGYGTLNLLSGAKATIGNQLVLRAPGTLQLNGGTLELKAFNNQGGQVQWNSGRIIFTQDTLLTSNMLNTLVGTSHALENPQVLEGIGGTTTTIGNTHFAIDGGQLNASILVNQGNMVVNKGNVTARDHFTNGSSVVIQNIGNANFAGGVTNDGTFQLGSTAARTSGELFVNNGLLSGRGHVEHVLRNNGVIQVNAGDHLINDNGEAISINANQLQLSGGRFDVTGSLKNDAGAFVTGHGTIGTSIANNTWTFLNEGTIAASGGALHFHGDFHNSADGKVITSGNTMTTFWDDVEHNGAEIRTAVGSSTVFFGSVSGAGPFTGTGSILFEGDLNPGNSPANVLFEGNLHLGDSGALVMELGGLLVGTEYDRLTVHGDVSLNGSLYVDLINGFRPKYGDEFLLIDNRGLNAISGQFAGLDHGSIFTSTGGQRYLVNYHAGFSGHGFAITAVPEPSTTILILLTVGVIALGRRNRQVMSQANNG